MPKIEEEILTGTGEEQESTTPVPSPPSSPLSTLSSNHVESLKIKARSSLYFFAKFILGFKDLTKEIHKPICHLLSDPTKLKQRIILPRGWFKTTVCSIAYPLWRATKDSNIRILLAQNTSTNALAKLKSIREIVETNQLFRTLFPEILPTARSKWTAECLTLNRTSTWPEGTFEGVGTRTQVTSRHYDVIIEDDTVAPDLDELGVENICPTKEDIEKAIGWHRLVPPLFTNPKTGINIVVGTRWFQVDLLSWIEKNEPYFCSYVRACRETGGISDPNGQTTFPERFDEGVLDQLKASMGPYMFACLYLNNPMRSEDMTFQKEWFRFYETQPTKLFTYITVDLAGDPKRAKKGGKASDYNVVMTCGKHQVDGNVFVLDYWRRKANPGEVINEIFSQVRKYNPLKVGIESVGYQESLQHFIEERQRKENFWFLIEGLKHGSQKKEWRIRGLQPFFSTGKIFVRTWMNELLAELEAFPLGAHDDLADCLSMQLGMWLLTSSSNEKEKREAKHDPETLEWAIDQITKRRLQKRGYLFDIIEGGNSGEVRVGLGERYKIKDRRELRSDLRQN